MPKDAMVTSSGYLWVNLIALLARFIKTCRNRLASPTSSSSGMSAAISVSSENELFAGPEEPAGSGLPQPWGARQTDEPDSEIACFLWEKSRRSSKIRSMASGRSMIGSSASSAWWDRRSARRKIQSCTMAVIFMVEHRQEFAASHRQTFP